MRLAIFCQFLGCLCLSRASHPVQLLTGRTWVGPLRTCYARVKFRCACQFYVNFKFSVQQRYCDIVFWRLSGSEVVQKFIQKVWECRFGKTLCRGHQLGRLDTSLPRAVSEPKIYYTCALGRGFLSNNHFDHQPDFTVLLFRPLHPSHYLFPFFLTTPTLSITICRLSVMPERQALLCSQRPIQLGKYPAQHRIQATPGAAIRMTPSARFGKRSTKHLTIP